MQYALHFFFVQYGMRALVQRISSGKVTINETQEVSGEIGVGLFVLLGIKKGDTKESAEKLALKISKLRIMSDDRNLMNLSITESTKNVLVVSQFTLYGNTKAGNRPSFIEAEEPIRARELYRSFIDTLTKQGISVATGSFGNYMKIETVLDGPVTLLLEY